MKRILKPSDSAGRRVPRYDRDRQDDTVGRPKSVGTGEMIIILPFDYNCIDKAYTSVTITYMGFRWNPEKDALLRSTRNISCEDLLEAKNDGRILHMEDHNTRPNQIAIYFQKGDYVYVAMCVIEGQGVYFVKTIYPSRKATKRLLPVE